MRLLLIGDVVGKPGRQIIIQALPGLRIQERLDLVVVNAENVAGGSGITPEIYYDLINAGVDCITLGDHAFRRREIFSILQSPTQHRPAGQLSPRSARQGLHRGHRPQSGRGGRLLRWAGCSCRRSIAPSRRPNGCWPPCPANVRVMLMDFHAEATSDKQLMGRVLDGRVTAVLGTHTHVPTADEQILPGGTAFQCDVGMTGPHESILGRRIDRVMETTRTFRPTQFEVASGDVRIHGTIVDADPETGRATAIQRLVVDEARAQQLAALAAAERGESGG